MSGRPRTVALFAERELGERALRLLLARSDARVVAVATDYGALERKWWPGEPIPDICSRAGLPCVRSEEPDALARLTRLAPGPDVVLSVLADRQISEKYVLWPAARPVHLHAAPFPEYLGRNCTHHAILGGAVTFGATLYAATPTPGVGDVVARASFAIPSGCTNERLFRLTVEHGKRLLEEHLGRVVAGGPWSAEPRVSGPSIVYEGLGEQDVTLDGTMPADLVDTTARAFYFPPFPAARVRVGRAAYDVIPESAVAAGSGPAGSSAATHEEGT